MRGIWPFNVKYLEQLNLLNISLILVILFMGGYEYYDFTRKDNIRISPGKNMRLDTDEVKLDDTRKLLTRGDYMVVAEKNVFHPERKPIKSQPDAPPPEFIVYGTIVAGTKAAFVEDKKNPYSTQGRGQRQRMLHEGDILSGYKITGITTEDVEFTKDEDKLTIKVIDPARRKARQSGESTKTAAAPPPAQATLPATQPPSMPLPAQMQPPAAQMPPPTLPMPPPAAPQNPASKPQMPQMLTLPAH